MIPISSSDTNEFNLNMAFKSHLNMAFVTKNNLVTLLSFFLLNTY